MSLVPALRDSDSKSDHPKILLQILDLIPHFGSFEKLEEALEGFVQQHLDAPYKIVNSKTTSFHGNSDDEVFFLYDPQGKMHYVVKAFLNPDQLESNFIPEFAGNGIIQAMQLPRLKSVCTLGLGRCDIDDKQYGLLLCTAAPGKRVDQFLTAIQQNKAKLEEAIEAFKAVGAAYAELHQPDDTRSIPFPKKWADRLESNLRKLDDPIISEKLQGKVDIAKLQDYGRNLIQICEKIHIPPAYSHGSAHLKNIFYDPASGDVILIDTGKLHHSINREGLPCEDAAFDLMRIEENVVHSTLDKLEQEEVSALL